ncbi:hypothetical protein [Bacillus paranthracis]|uniref:hypothetical protein n=1 Tax=Bacillus paranthracis TaxID=2026186 RepID=UPI0039A3A8C0
MLAMRKKNPQLVSEKKPLFDLQDMDEYLYDLVRSKSFFSLGILVLISIAVIYIPYGTTLKIWLKDVPIWLKSIIKASVYTGPIVVIFCYLFKDVIKQLFQKMSIKHHMICVIAAVVLIIMGLYWVLFLNNLTSINPVANVMTKKSEQDMLLSIPGVLIQLLGENLMFISFLLFWYKCMKYIKISSKVVVVASILLAGITFGMMHLTAYQFNVLHCILIIGIPATTHLLWFAKYRNAHMAYWLHVYYDLILILWGVLG